MNKTNLTVILLVLCCAGCAQRTYTRNPDGSVELRSSTLLVGSRVSAVSVSEKGLKVGNAESAGDPATIDAIARAAAIAAATAAKSTMGVP